MNIKQPADGERRSEMAGLGRDMRDGGEGELKGKWHYCPFLKTKQNTT